MFGPVTLSVTFGRVSGLDLKGPFVPSSAAVHDALCEIFDKRSELVLVVSGYDETILYANPALASSGANLGTEPARTLPVDFVGRSIRDVTELFGLQWPDTPLGEALRTGEMIVRHVNDSPYWVCASTLPLSDVSTTGLASAHAPELSEQEAVRQHAVIVGQVTIALEFAESERLIQVGMEALHRARQRIHTLRETLLFSELKEHFPTD